MSSDRSRDGRAGRTQPSLVIQDPARKRPCVLEHSAARARVLTLATDKPKREDAVVPPSTSAVGTPLELFQSIVAEAEDGVLVLGPDGRVSYANAAAEFLLGRRRAELVGEVFEVARAVADNTTRVNVISRDGRVRLAELRVEPLPVGPSGSMVLRLKDITSYHQDAARAREQVRRRDEFLAMLSHEVRNPLAAIRSAASLLAREDIDGNVRRRAGDVFDRQFQHLTHILDDLLDVARISRGKLEIVKERVDLNQVVRDAVEEAAPLIGKREHRLQVDLPPRKVWVEGDATRLEQVVVNLVNNAAKFTPPQGHIFVNVVAGPMEVEVCVRDDGPGIAEDLLPHVFEPFVQGKQSLARNEGGLGIGLALVHTIVLLHGGRVCVGPNPAGQGVAFTVKLPVLAAGAEVPAELEPAGGQGGGPTRRLRLLLIEDVADTRDVLKQLLELDGYEVLEAGDGFSGLAAILDQRPDVALVDIGLPGLDGYELARQVRREARGRDTRLVAVTGYAMPKDVRAARAAGFDGHLIKPVHYPELMKLLRSFEAASAVPSQPPGGDCPGAGSS